MFLPVWAAEIIPAATRWRQSRRPLVPNHLCWCCMNYLTGVRASGVSLPLSHRPTHSTNNISLLHTDSIFCFSTICSYSFLFSPAERWRPRCHRPAHELIGQEQWWRAQLPGVLAADWATCKQTRGVQPIERPSDTLFQCHVCYWLVCEPSGKHPNVCFFSAAGFSVFISSLRFLLTLSSPAIAKLALSQSTTEHFQQNTPTSPVS